MRKIILTLIIMLTLTLISYGEDSKIYIDVGNEYIERGQIFEVKIKGQGLSEMYGIKVCLSYDSNYLEPVDFKFTRGKLLNHDNYFVALNNLNQEKNMIRFMGTFLGEKPLPEEEGELLTLKFKATDRGQTELKLEELKILKNTAEPMDFAWDNKSIYINSHTGKKKSTDKNSFEKQINIIADDVNNFMIERIFIHNINRRDLLLRSGIYEISYKYGQIFKPVKIRIRYEKANNENELAIYCFNEKLDKWIYLGGKAHSISQTVEAEVNHLSRFAVFENINPKQFSDMGNHWSNEYVKGLAELEIIEGYEDNTFKPDRKVTRSEFSKIIVSALNLELCEDNVKFTDNNRIPPWSRVYVNTAYENGILKGYEDNKFYPDRIMTRAEIATALARIIKDKDIKDKDNNIMIGFIDANDIPKWSQDGVKKCIKYGILNGYDDNTLRPNKPVTRAEIAKIIYKLLAVGI